MRAISLAEANKIINGTFASARKRKAHALAAIVLDAGGRVKAFQKQDGASLMRFEIAYGRRSRRLLSTVHRGRCCRKRKRSLTSCARSPNWPMGRFFSKRAASSSATPPAKS
jgi:hypothetical protein